MVKSNRFVLQKGLFFFFLLFTGIHLFFLQSDPNILLDNSRGAFTDEGLYLYQVSNGLKGADFNMFESDGFLKTPIYNLLMVPFVFFNKLWIIRLAALLFIAVSLCIWFRITQVSSGVLLIIGLCLTMQSNFFGHSHLAMAECFVFGFLILSLSSISHPDAEKRYLSLFYLMMAIGCKIQYIYLGVLIIPYLAILRGRKFTMQQALVVGFPFLILILFFSVYFFEYAYIIAFAKTGKLQEYGHWFFRVNVNFKHLCSNSYNIFFFAVTLLMSAGLITIWKNLEKRDRLNLYILISLIIFEGHKLLYIYLPQRYLYILFGALIIFNIQVAQLLFNHRKSGVYTKWLIWPLFLFMASWSYWHLWNSKSYDMRNARKLIRSGVSENKALVGPWGPSLSLGLTNTSHTAWYDFFENREYWQDNPDHVLISELDYKDNHGLFWDAIENASYQKIDSFNIKSWKLALFSP